MHIRDDSSQNELISGQIAKSGMKAPHHSIKPNTIARKSVDDVVHDQRVACLKQPHSRTIPSGKIEQLKLIKINGGILDS